MAMRIKGDVLIVGRAGDETVRAMVARFTSDPQMKIDGRLVFVALPEDVSAQALADTVAAAVGPAEGGG